MDEINAILDASTSERDGTLSILLLDTSCTITEYAAIILDYVDREKKCICICEGRGKERTTYVGNQIRKQIQRYLNGREQKAGCPLWASHKDGKQFTTYGIQMLIAG